MADLLPFTTLVTNLSITKHCNVFYWEKCSFTHHYMFMCRGYLGFFSSVIQDTEKQGAWPDTQYQHGLFGFPICPIGNRKPTD